MAIDYEKLQATAIRLIAGAGGLLNFQSYQGAFNNVTGKYDSETVMDHFAVGVVIDSDRSLVTGTRIEAGNRLLLLDPQVTPEQQWKWNGDYVQDSGDAIGTFPGVLAQAGQVGLMSIVRITELKPADTILLYEVEVQK